MAILAIQTVIMTVRSGPFTSTEKCVWVLIAISLVVVELRAIESDRQKFSNEQTQIRKNENDKFAAILSQNQKDFSATIGKIETLLQASEEAINSTIGGDSYCRVEFEHMSPDQNKLTPWALNMGQFPLYGVSVRVVDVGSLSSTNQQEAFFGSIFSIGELPSSMATPIPTWSINLASHEDRLFNLFFSARNGLWTQQTKFHYFEGKWIWATRVLRTHGGHEKQLYTEIDPYFPRDLNGHIDWNAPPKP